MRYNPYLLVCFQSTALALGLGCCGTAFAEPQGTPIQLAQIEGPGRAVGAAATQSDFYSDTLPITLNDSQIGMIRALVTLSGYATVNAAQLDAILGPQLSAEHKNILLSYRGQYVLLEDLRRQGILVIYDPSKRVIKIGAQILKSRQIQDQAEAQTVRPNPIPAPVDKVQIAQIPPATEKPVIKAPPITRPSPPSRAKPVAPTPPAKPLAKPKAAPSKPKPEKVPETQTRPQQAPAPDGEDYYPFEVPLLVNGALIGDVTAEATISGYARLSAPRLLELLSDRLSDADIATLESYGPAPVALEQYNADGFRIDFDSGELVVNMILALDGIQKVSVTKRTLENLNLSEYQQPANFSAGLSIVARPRYIHKSLNNETGFAPTAVDARGFVSTGGFNNLALVYELDALEGRDQFIRRKDVTLIHDNFQKALRFQAGDIRPSITGFQSGLDILGIGVERNYGAIQPFRNLRPGGKTTFTLERSAQITYEVNGVVIGTDRLAPGDYDIRDLPLTTGANDVRVIIDDEFGTREVGTYSTFVDTELLSADTLIFGANVGVRKASGYDGFNPNYDDELLGMAFLEAGISDSLTLGAQVEATTEGGYLGTRSVMGFGSNLFAAEAGLSAFEGLETGYVAALRFTRRPFRETGRFYNEFDSQISYRSQDFKTIGNTGMPRGSQWQIAMRNNTTFNKYSINLNGNWLKTDFDEFSTIGATVSTHIKNMNVSAGYQAQYSKLDDNFDNRVFVTLSKNFGRYGNVRSRTATGPYETELEWRRLSTRGVGALSGRAAYLSGELGDELSADASYIASRAEFDVSHLSAFENGFGQTQSSVTDARIGVGLGFADGAFGFGRPVSDGFVVLTAHPSLEGRTIQTSQGAGRISGKSGLGGSAIVPLSGPYREQIHRVDVQDLPPGYDIGDSQLKLFPSNFTGYKVRVGTDPSALVIGYLKTADDSPVALAVGKLIPISNPESESIDFFTNRTGRFVAERVSAGKYRMVLLPDEVEVTILDIGEGEDGVESVGKIIVNQPIGG